MMSSTTRSLPLPLLRFLLLYGVLFVGPGYIILAIIHISLRATSLSYIHTMPGWLLSVSGMVIILLNAIILGTYWEMDREERREALSRHLIPSLIGCTVLFYLGLLSFGVTLNPLDGGFFFIVAACTLCSWFVSLFLVWDGVRWEAQFVLNSPRLMVEDRKRYVDTNHKTLLSNSRSIKSDVARSIRKWRLKLLDYYVGEYPESYQGENLSVVVAAFYGERLLNLRLAEFHYGNPQPVVVNMQAAIPRTFDQNAIEKQLLGLYLTPLALYKYTAKVAGRFATDEELVQLNTLCQTLCIDFDDAMKRGKDVLMDEIADKELERVMLLLQQQLGENAKLVDDATIRELGLLGAQDRIKKVAQLKRGFADLNGIAPAPEDENVETLKQRLREQAALRATAHALESQDIAQGVLLKAEFAQELRLKHPELFDEMMEEYDKAVFQINQRQQRRR